ncbi:MAG: tetratricopeptide repeat protein [Thermoflavifilum sp.]|nr:tetratricopeptide repeat protein [Thermoflavifilum sp.]
MDRLQQLKELFDKQPDDSFLKYALALEYLKRGEEERAEQYFRSIVEHDPTYLAVYYAYGQWLETKGRQAEAADMYAKGIQQAMLQGDDRTLRELKTALAAVADINS